MVVHAHKKQQNSTSTSNSYHADYCKKKTYCSETYNFQRSYHIITSSNNVHLNNHRYFSGNNIHLNDQIANNFQATLHA